MAQDLKQASQVSFKDTLNLPHTEFPLRPNHASEDAALLEYWRATGLYSAAFELNKGKEKYILHAGPPYANGPIHLGHAYSTILKDFVTKSHRMMGYHVPVTPGWDCHGLPIEINVVKQYPDGVAPLVLKSACREYAQKWVDTQREQFMQLGIIMNWHEPYLTMSPHYESATVHGFGILFKEGYIERKSKTVAWCFSCKTVLASAEIEYKQRKDPSLYVLFQIKSKEKVAELLAGSAENSSTSDEPVSLLVWTTTPWTLPLNRGVLLKKDAEYYLVRLAGRLLIIGAQTVSVLEGLLGQKSELIKVLSGAVLEGALVQHPFESSRVVPVLFDESVGLTEGTACVHMAPGCGPLDYELGVKHGLEIYSPVDESGRYTAGIYPRELVGMAISDAQGWVIKELQNQGLLVFKSSVTHSYPHCWRCRNGLIFRATKQWFFNLAHKAIQKRALEAADTIKFMPEQGRNFLKATIGSRWEWCLSRQRVWGVPIPALVCTQCDYIYSTPDFIDAIAQGIAQKGIEYWDEVAIQDIAGAPGQCPLCNRKDTLKKEQDILDVWFEAGMSHYAVLYKNPDLRFPADVYLEGIDQHRGWFQSSLLTALAIEGSAPMYEIMTHGFTVDEKGQKMSKSLGNVVAPQEIITQLGTDGLRLWVASIGNEGDAVVSRVLLNNVAEVYRKIRNTARFLLANLYDFDRARDSMTISELLPLDRAILFYCARLNADLIEQYRLGKFTAVFHGLADFSTVQLSSWYLDIVKDRLYVEKADGELRRSAQTALWYLVDALTKLMAPILSFSAEQISTYYQRDKKVSIHLQDFADLGDVNREIIEVSRSFLPSTSPDSLIRDYDQLWKVLRVIRDVVLKALEGERERGVIKHSLEARVTIFFGPDMNDYNLIKSFFESLSGQVITSSVQDFLKEFFIVSQVVLAQERDKLPETVLKGCYVLVEHALGSKCPRCWMWDEEPQRDSLCRRCAALLAKKIE